MSGNGKLTPEERERKQQELNQEWLERDGRAKDVLRDYKAWRLVKWMMIVVLLCSICLIVTYMSGQLVIFEDGSFILFNITGCLPGAICNIGG